MTTTVCVTQTCNTLTMLPPPNNKSRVGTCRINIIRELVTLGKNITVKINFHQLSTSQMPGGKNEHGAAWVGPLVRPNHHPSKRLLQRM